MDVGWNRLGSALPKPGFARAVLSTLLRCRVQAFARAGSAFVDFQIVHRCLGLANDVTNDIARRDDVEDTAHALPRGHAGALGVGEHIVGQREQTRARALYHLIGKPQWAIAGVLTLTVVVAQIVAYVKSLRK